ncbi:MAG TPA: hypothetical protein VD962_10770 [Rubricoccaceae bacterium]|nr:hypothetical protein [Rubricoccaceae bacterium]
MIRPRPAPLFIALIALVAAGCDQLDAQAEFRAAAARAPEGITRTQDGVTVEGGEQDNDDWRTAPLFSGRAAITRWVYPNPAPLNQAVSLQLRVFGFDAIPGGVRLVGYTESGRRVVLEDDPTAVSDGFYDYTFFPAELVDGTASGLRRVILFDRFRSEPISYGDIRIE